MIYPESFENKIGFDAVRHDLLELCQSALGQQHAQEMAFHADYSTVKRLLEETAEMVTLIESGDDLPLGNVKDVRDLLQTIRVAGTWLAAPDLALVGRTLEAMGELASYFAGHRNAEGTSSVPRLDTVAADLQPLPECASAIRKIMDRYGNILDNASSELADIRHRMARLQSSISGIMRRVIAAGQQSGWLEAGVSPTLRDGRLVVPVAPMNKRRVPGIVHDESATGKTVFIEPAEVVEANNRLRELEGEERREINRILAETAAVLRTHIDEMMWSLDIMGELDFIHAKALHARDVGGRMPVVHDAPAMEWYQATHPVLLKSLRRQQRAIVPLDIRLTPQERILIISGPNAGGKSVVLKTVGTLQYMLQCGMLPPMLDNSHAGIFSDLMIDIGDDQSIENDLSTYSSHLRSMKHLVLNGGASTLILIDEMGSGTDPQMGGAIAQATLRAFNDKQMWGIVTTHYQNIKHFAEDTDGLVNGSMLYDRHLMQPTFALSIGNPGSSFAMEIARKIGLPKGIIDEAEEIVGSDYINIDKYLLDIARDKRYWENKRLSIKQKEKKIDSTLERYELEAETLRKSRREILDEARRQAADILQGSNAAIERTIHEIRRTQAEKEATAEARRRLESEKEQLKAGTDAQGTHSGAAKLLGKAPKSRKKQGTPAAKPVAEPISAGDNVRLDGSGTVGKVIEVRGNQALVAFGMLKTTVDTVRLTRTLAKVQSGAGKSSFVSAATTDRMRDRQLNFRQEIDVRGMRADEALQAVTYFMDDAIQFNASRVRILHGTGTGALRQVIRQYLQTLPAIKGYHDEDVRLGGAGITVIDL